MDQCVVCKRKVESTDNWIKAHLSGGFAIFQLELLRRVSAFRKRGTGRKRGVESEQSGKDQLNRLIGASKKGEVQCH